MTPSTRSALLGATAFAGELLELTGLLLPLLVQIGRLLTGFLRGAVTPSTTYEFEKALRDQLRLVGREMVCWAYHHLEPSTLHDMPAQIGVEADLVPAASM